MGLYTPALIGYAAMLPWDRMKTFPAAGYQIGRQATQQYRGPAMIITRSSDDSTEGIGFVNGNIDTATALAFGGGSTVTVQRIYNAGSAGSAQDLLQTTLTAQPVLISSGTLNTKNGRPALLFSGAQWLYSANQAAWIENVPYWINFISALTAANFNGYAFGTANNSRDEGLQVGPNGTGAYQVKQAGGDAVSVSVSPSLTTALTIQGILNTKPGSKVYFNGALAGSSSTTPSGLLGTSPGNFQIGGALSTPEYAGLVSEVSGFIANPSASDKATYDILAARDFGISGVTQ